MGVRNGRAGCLLLLSIWCFCGAATAQLSVGLQGEYNRNYLVTNNANRAFTNYVPLNGYGVSIPVEYRFNEWFALAATPGVIQKNYRQERSAFFQGVYQETRNNYIELPVTARIFFGARRIHGFVDGGLYAGYWLSSRIKGVGSNILDVTGDEDSATASVFDYQRPFSFNEKYSFQSQKDNRFEFGWVAGLGAGYELTSRLRIFLEGRLLFAFTDQQKNYMINQVPRYNTTYGAGLGVMYHLPSSNHSNR